VKKARKKSPRARRRQARPKTGAKRTERRSQEAQSEVNESGLLRELTEHTGVSPADAGGDIDADWQRAQSSGEESVEAAWPRRIRTSSTSLRARSAWSDLPMLRSSPPRRC
jgi:hypothetical protein